MKNYVDLLPQDHHRGALIRLRLVQWSVVLGAAAVVTGVVTAIERSQSLEQRTHMNALETKYHPILKLQSEVKSIGANVRELEHREAMTLQLADEHPTLTVLGIVSRAARKCEGTVAVSRLTLVAKTDSVAASMTNAASGTDSTSPVADSPRKVLTLQGIGLDNLSVVRLVASINEEDAFQRVELKASGSPTDDRGGQVATLRYLIECAY